MKNEKIYKNKKTLSIVFTIITCFVFVVLAANVALIQTKAIDISPSEPFSFDLANKFYVWEYRGASSEVVDGVYPFADYSVMSDPQSEKPLFSLWLETYTPTDPYKFLAFSEQVYVDSVSLSFRFADSSGSSIVRSELYLNEFPYSSEKTIIIPLTVDSVNGGVTVVDVPISRWMETFGIQIRFEFADGTYEPFEFVGLTLNVSGSGSEDISLQISDRPYVEHTTPITTAPSFVPPPVTAPDYSAVTEAPSPVDEWLAPAHGGVGGAIEPAESALSGVAFADGSSWLDRVVTFLVTQPLVAPFFALSCALLITRVAFGGK